MLRRVGLRLVTLAERYGVPADENVADVEWLTEAGRLGEVVFMKDTRIRFNAAEKKAVRDSDVRCFCLTRQDLRADEMAKRFLRNLHGIETACEQLGPFIYAVHENRVQRLELL